MRVDRIYHTTINKNWKQYPNNRQNNDNKQNNESFKTLLDIFSEIEAFKSLMRRELSLLQKESSPNTRKKLLELLAYYDKKMELFNEYKRVYHIDIKIEEDEILRDITRLKYRYKVSDSEYKSDDKAKSK